MRARASVYFRSTSSSLCGVARVVGGEVLGHVEDVVAAELRHRVQVRVLDHAREGHARVVGVDPEEGGDRSGQAQEQAEDADGGDPLRAPPRRLPRRPSAVSGPEAGGGDRGDDDVRGEGLAADPHAARPGRLRGGSARPARSGPRDAAAPLEVGAQGLEHGRAASLDVAELLLPGRRARARQSDHARPDPGRADLVRVAPRT